MIKISLSGHKEAKARFAPTRGEKALSASLKRLVEYCENRIGWNALNIVYGYRPKTNKYVRKGRLLGGRGNALSGGKPATTPIGKLAYQVEANPTLKGAAFNYAPYVNSGRGWMKRVGARPFWTVSVKETKQKAPEILKEAVIKEFN